MKLFEIKYNANFKMLSAEIMQDHIFAELWRNNQNKSKAYEYFPRDWHWTGIERGDEIEGDMLYSLPSGLAFSENAFNAVCAEFPGEIKCFGIINIESDQYYWYQPPLANLDTSLNMFILDKKFITVVSENFVDFWKRHKFTGIEFKETC